MTAHPLTKHIVAFALDTQDLPVSVRRLSESVLSLAGERVRSGAQSPVLLKLGDTMRALGARPVTRPEPDGPGGTGASSVCDATLMDTVAMAAGDGSPAVPGVFLPVAAASSSVGRWTAASDADVVAAFSVGAEVNQRVIEIAGEAYMRRGWDVSSLLGALGASLATARLLEMTAAQTENAVGLALSQGAGLRLALGSMAGLLQQGTAAANGVQAALLARQGFTGPRDSIEARRGLLRTTVADVDLAPLDHGLGTRWALAELPLTGHGQPETPPLPPSRAKP